MAQGIGKIVIELDREARMVMTATRIQSCQAIYCKYWFEGDCQLKTIFITPAGGCGNFEPKPGKESKNAN